MIEMMNNWNFEDEPCDVHEAIAPDEPPNLEIIRVCDQSRSDRRNPSISSSRLRHWELLWEPKKEAISERLRRSAGQKTAIKRSADDDRHSLLLSWTDNKAQGSTKEIYILTGNGLFENKPATREPENNAIFILRKCFFYFKFK